MKDFPSGVAGIPEFDPDDVVSSELVETPATTNETSLSRRVALQILYEIDSADHAPGDVIDGQIGYSDLSRRGIRNVRRLVQGVLQNRDQLDDIIRRFAPDFPVEQIAIVDRNVLRIAIHEMVMGTRVPVKVSIDEAVEVAKVFGAEGSPRFVNGVLGTIADHRDELVDLLVKVEPHEGDHPQAEDNGEHVS